ncbi:tRNA (adenosine(37)-N6)-dimethylallyltransferase MiaA [Pseudoflavonifractor phocaeensis]|uniref:tRNA (adenosine(37)-N6)-dimethylallyltransferase MiaA n=1 Tax=Pseudoflavonifractor phocaeensis TaxID=1870988 RepID=UPI0019592BF8|nr:tRNA (adenosine(37)-N6)-dimethylallyltransferase MiaA [Pseudoflavonifractor phocaeensis]MBM6870455.1 tRNA (adenosine(37)-N6)-dimethylallyltransferase MiaA [Pseudoflavonifractor phocaeensis]MBM6937603.1 tRNA (adenosine(37)-N6)-dimethylallyltransferase MiaA [Pseudoflavonifractor phocaeensis]
MAEQGKLVVVLGTTACGKSGLGVELALRFGGEIVSADSRQVYRGLDLGTGKVTAEETKGVPHYLLDVVSPNESYSVAQFQQDAYAAIDGILARGKPPFLVGGTGLYVRAVAEGYTFQEARPDPALRARLEGQDAAALYALFQQKTGLTLSESERHNRQRLIRTLEKVYHGDSLTEAPRHPRYQVLQLGMTYPREVLNQRIEERLWRRIDDGMIEEVANLRANGATDAFLEGLGLEYRHILWYLQGKYESVDQLCEELGRAIRQFAKRQVSWFKRDKDVLWLDTGGDFLAQATQAVERFLQG